MYEWDSKIDGTDTNDPVEGPAQVMRDIADSGKKVVVIKAILRTNGKYIAPCVEENKRSIDKRGISRDESLPLDFMAEA